MITQALKDQFNFTLSDADLAAAQQALALLAAHEAGTHAHALRVGHYAGLIAQQLGCSATEIQAIELAASLHDIGKLTLPLSLLLNDDALDAAEYAQIKTHTQAGYDLLLRWQTPLGDVAAIAARDHHERLDGSGYAGRTQQQISPFAQLVAVADVFDAMTVSRSYQPARSISAALREMAHLPLNPIFIKGLAENITPPQPKPPQP